MDLRLVKKVVSGCVDQMYLAQARDFVSWPTWS